MVRMCAIATLFVVLPVAATAQSSGPSLAEIARRSELANPNIPKAKKTYTNADLSTAGLPPAPEASPAQAVGAKPSGNQSPAAVAARPGGETPAAQAATDVQVEEVWRRRADRIRDSVSRLQARLKDLSSRPANPNPSLQQRVEKEITGIRSDFVQLRLQWTKLEQDAKAAKVSTLWIEPSPQFPQ